MEKPFLVSKHVSLEFVSEYTVLSFKSFQKRCV